MGLLALVVRLVHWAYRLTASTLMAAGAIGQVALIVSRNLFGAQPAWSTVAATLALATGGTLYIGLCPSHIAFRLVNDRLERRHPKVKVIGTTMGALVSIALAYLGVRAVMESYAIDARFQSFDVPVWVPLLAVPLAATVLAIRFLHASWQRLRGEDQ